MTIPKNPVQNNFEIRETNILPEGNYISMEEVLKFPVPDNINEGEELEDLFPLNLDISLAPNEESQNET